MHTKGTSRYCWVIVCAVVGWAGAAGAVPLGTAFAYQGRFLDNGQPAGGTYDFTFKLFDAASGGTQLGSTNGKDDIGVTDGYFTVTLDFGEGQFAGQARWLEIGVRPGGSTGAYSTLTPRQELKPIPYAAYAANGSAGGIGGSGTANYLPKFTATNAIADSVVYESSGKIGIGTTAPWAKLHVYEAGDAQRPFVINSNSVLDTAGKYIGMFFAGASGGPPNAYIDAYTWASGSIGFRFGTFNNGLQDSMVITGPGNVGMGTTSPGRRLDIADTISAYLPLRIASSHTGVGSGIELDAALLGAGGRNYEIFSSGSGNGSIGGSKFAIRDASGIQPDWQSYRFLIDPDGRIGIGTPTPAEKLDVIGIVRCVDVVETSDERLKTNIKPVTGVLSNLQKIPVVSFQWNENGIYVGARTGEQQTGVLAQDVERVFPQLVSSPTGHYKAVSYGQLTAMLLAAVQELKAENDSLKQRLDALEKAVQK